MFLCSLDSLALGLVFNTRLIRFYMDLFFTPSITIRFSKRLLRCGISFFKRLNVTCEFSRCSSSRFSFLGVVLALRWVVCSCSLSPVWMCQADLISPKRQEINLGKV